MVAGQGWRAGRDRHRFRPTDQSRGRTAAPHPYPTLPCLGGRLIFKRCAMSQFLQVLLSGLATGSIYALVAIGFTLVWQAAQTVNFAQGEFVMLPAFFVLVGMNFGLPLWASAVRPRDGGRHSCSACCSRSSSSSRYCRMAAITLIIATMALGILLKESVKEFYSARGPAVSIPVPQRPDRCLRRGRVAAGYPEPRDLAGHRRRC